MNLPAPDFLRPVRGTPVLAWAFVALAGGVLALAVLEAVDAWQARDTLRDTVQALQAPPRRAAAADAVPPAVAALLGAPWGARIAAIESASAPGLAWLSMELAQDGELRLVGTGAPGAGALPTAERLRASGAWASVLVVRAEYAADGQERFEIRASPKDAGR